MKGRSKIFKYILIGLVGIIVIAAAGIYLYLQSFQPKYSGELTLQGLQEEVEVYFDDYGIPHIYGQNEEDTYYALGYLHARERLFQMEMLRRVGSGRLAEILGEDLAKTDRFFRTIGIRESAKESAKKYLSERKDPYQKAALAYLDGVNTYIKDGKTPLEFQLLSIEKTEFTPEDMYCVAGYMGFSFNVAFQTDPVITKIHNKLGEKYTKDFATLWKRGTQTIPVYNPSAKESIEDGELISKATSKIFKKLPIPIWLGSNSWIVSGEKTESGKVFFANDAHIGYGQPSVWYESHLEYPGFSFYGNYIAGMPFAPIGHTRKHAWGITMLENDDTDLYEEKFNSDNPNQVQFKDTWEDVKTRSEVVNIKGQEALEFDVKTTRHGPIINDCVEGINDITENPIAAFMTLTSFPNQAFQAFYNFGKSENLNDFQNACALIHAPGFSVMYGDEKGNIAWLATAKLTKRPKHVNSKYILNGYDGNDEVLGFYDFSENPKSINPPTNYVFSANNQPDSAFGVMHQGYYLPEFRARRIVSLLDKGEKWNTEKMKKMITDAVSINYPEIAQEIINVIEKSGQQLTENEQKAIALLKSWDGNHDLESLGATIYYKLLYHVLAEAMIDEIGKDDFEAILNIFMMQRSTPFIVSNDTSLWWDNVATDAKETRQDIFSNAFKKSITELESQLGSNPENWKWKKVHTITHQHAFGRDGGLLGWYFNVGALPINGGHEVINNISFDLNEEGLYPPTHGPSKRILIDFADIENSVSIIPTGQSGVVSSKHYDDQAQMYADGKFRKQMMNETEIKEKGRKLILKAK